jgi:hypothetical protein
MIYKLAIGQIKYSPSQISNIGSAAAAGGFDKAKELFNELAQDGSCETYSKERIYLVGWALARYYPELEFEIEEE